MLSNICNVEYCIIEGYNEWAPPGDQYEPLGQVTDHGVTYDIYRINRSDNEELTRPAGTQQDFMHDAQSSLLYRHRNGILAAYAEYMLKLNKFSTRAGLRLESSNIKVTYPGNNDPARTAFSTTLRSWTSS